VDTPSTSACHCIRPPIDHFALQAKLKWPPSLPTHFAIPTLPTPPPTNSNSPFTKSTGSCSCSLFRPRPLLRLPLPRSSVPTRRPPASRLPLPLPAPHRHPRRARSRGAGQGAGHEVSPILLSPVLTAPWLHHSIFSGNTDPRCTSAGITPHATHCIIDYRCRPLQQAPMILNPCLCLLPSPVVPCRREPGRLLQCLARGAAHEPDQHGGHRHVRLYPQAPQPGLSRRRLAQVSCPSTSNRESPAGIIYTFP
jgi:hypothetical protein